MGPEVLNHHQPLPLFKSSIFLEPISQVGPGSSRRTTVEGHVLLFAQPTRVLPQSSNAWLIRQVLDIFSRRRWPAFVVVATRHQVQCFSPRYTRTFPSFPPFFELSAPPTDSRREVALLPSEATLSNDEAGRATFVVFSSHDCFVPPDIPIPIRHVSLFFRACSFSGPTCRPPF